MEITAYLVDWKKTVKLLEADPNLCERLGSEEEETKWFEWLEWFPLRIGYYFACVEAWEAIRDFEGVPPALNTKAREFMDHLITYSDYHQDLGREAFLISMSPDSAKRFAALVEGVDFGVYREAFYSKVQVEGAVGDSLLDHSPSGNPKLAFEECFLPYVEAMIRAVKLAAKKKKGLLVNQL